MRAEDVPKAAIITPFGLFEFLRLPFSLKDATQTFDGLGLARAVFRFCISR